VTLLCDPAVLYSIGTGMSGAAGFHYTGLVSGLNVSNMAINAAQVAALFATTKPTAVLTSAAAALAVGNDAGGTGIVNLGGLSVNSGAVTSLDGGAITTDGQGTLRLHTQPSPPAAAAGGIYFDGTNFKFCANGTTWVALTLP